MRISPVQIPVACCLIALAALAPAQSKQKPGLWETTSSVSFNGSTMPQVPQAQMPQGMQMPQLPPGTQLPPGVQMPQMPQGAAPMGNPMGAPHTTQVCVTQAMIDKFGGPYSNPSHGDCQVTNIAITASGMTAQIACTGQMNTTGTVESTWSDGNTTQTKMHMSGTMQMGNNSRPVDVTMQSKSTYKGPDCGSVKPLPVPDSK